jgi:hypothetical protein
VTLGAAFIADADCFLAIGGAQVSSLTACEDHGRVSSLAQNIAELSLETLIWHVNIIQAIATMAYGVGDVDPCDIIVGPGNKWVTAAKSLISGVCAIGKCCPCFGQVKGDHVQLIEPFAVYTDRHVGRTFGGAGDCG